MTTFGIMKARIASEIIRDDLASQIVNAITDAIKFFEGKRLFLNEKRYRIDTVNGTEYYDLSGSGLLNASDGSATGTGEKILEIDSIRILVNGSTYRLKERTQGWFDEEQAPSTQYKGEPSDYGIYADQLRLGPVPNSAYQMTISALARLKTLAVDADTNNWMTEGEMLIREYAKVILYRSVLRNDRGLEFSMQAAADAQLALERKSSAKAMTGRIAATEF